jgi:hypothetical protein
MNITPEVIDGLPFYTLSQERIREMKIGEVIEYLIYIKSKYNVSFPDDNAINDACNVLNRLPRQQEVSDWLVSHEKCEK